MYIPKVIQLGKVSEDERAFVCFTVNCQLPQHNIATFTLPCVEGYFQLIYLFYNMK